MQAQAWARAAAAAALVGATRGGSHGSEILDGHWAKDLASALLSPAPAPERYEYAREWPLLLRWVPWLRELPLDDPRFVLAVAFVMSAAAFVGNLILQYDMEEEEDPGDEERAASDRHAMALTTLHLLLDQKPAWLDLDLAKEVKTLLTTQLAKSGPADDGSTVVDLLLLAQLHSARPKADEGERDGGGDVDEIARSRATQLLQLLQCGPAVRKNLVYEDRAVRIIADYLTQTVVVCVDAVRVEAAALLSELVAVADSRLSSVELCDTGVATLPAVAHWAEKIFREAILGQAGKQAGAATAALDTLRDFRCCFVGHGVNGSIATALAILVRHSAKATGGGEGDSKWLGSQAAGNAEAIAFGDPPCFAGAHAPFVRSFANGADLVPRLSACNVRDALAFLRSVRMALPPRERLESLLEQAAPETVLRELDPIVASAPGLFEGRKASSKAEDQGPADASEQDRLVHAGKVVAITSQGHWTELQPREAEQLPLYESSQGLAAHSMEAYAQALATAR